MRHRGSFAAHNAFRGTDPVGSAAAARAFFMF